MKLEMYLQNIIFNDFSPNDKTKKLIRQYIPDVKIEESIDKIIIEPTKDFLIKIQEGKPIFNISNEEAIYSTQKIISEDIMAITSKISEYLWSKKGIYSIHSSAVRIDDKTILIPGRSGAGKTTFMMELIKRRPDTKIISGDRTLIDNEMIVAGTKILNFNAASLAEEFPYFSEILRNYKFENRVTFSPEQSPFNYHFEPTGIDAIVYPQKHSGNFMGIELNGTPKLTRFVNQGYYFLEEFPRLLVSNLMPLTTPVAYKERQKILHKMKQLTDSTPSYATSGKLSDIVDFVEREIL